jgi:predicted phage terminase large subunit-like protein
MKSSKISPQEAAIELLKRRQARNNLIPFVEYTKRDFVTSAHHLLVASYLEQVERGEINRLMIFSPPRHSKSELASRRLPAWYLGRNPNKQIIAASYNSDLASSFGRDVRNLVADSYYQNIFPGVSLRQDSKAADRWNTVNGGSYLSAGVGSGITGHGADLGVIDDPFKDRKEANSQTIRDNVWDWYRSAFYTRLMPGAAIILTLTRWHEDDLAGRLLKEMKSGGDQWTVLSLPALAEEDDMMRRSPGEALWPEWYPLATLQQIQEVIGTYDWNALYQQRPSVEEGNIFKRHWWKKYRELPEKCEIIQSWDTAFKDTTDSDYSVCTTWGFAKNQIFLIDRWKGKVEFPELKRLILAQALKLKANAVLVEDAASGQSLIQEMKKDLRLRIIPIKPDRDKKSRAYAVTPFIESGRVLLPEWGSWVEEYIDCMAKFPSGSDDDDVDSTTQALNYLRNRLHSDRYDQISPYNKPAIVSWDMFA